MLTRENRILGCLLGGALGDAIGSHFEGGLPQQGFSIPKNLRISDDTQLTIATCEAIIETGRVDPDAVANHFLRWFRQRRISGIGSSTLKSLSELDAGGHWALVGASGERAAGNGAAMRIAPLAFALNTDIASDRQTLRDVCRITHRNEEAYIGALAVQRTIRHAMAGNPLGHEILTCLVEFLPDSRVRDRLADLANATHSLEEYANRFDTTGYVVDSVPLAILAATQSTSILDTIRQLVACGGDTDTNCSIFAQIFGAVYGANCLPMEIVYQIDAASIVLDTATKLAKTLDA
jgi:ADP-ribosylglycohydrolase